MGYKNIKPYVTTIDELCSGCGLFTSNTDLNNGYGCKSKSKYKTEIGKCYNWACPLGNVPDIEDLKKYDKDYYYEYKDKCDDDGVIDSLELILVYKELTKNKNNL
jgi:hypothetical protein